MLYSAASLLLVVLSGLAIGWRWHGTPAETAGAFVLLLLLRMAFLWIGIILGLRAKSAEMANSIFGLLYPLTMLSSAFIDPSLMPTWLGKIAAWNPSRPPSPPPASCSATRASAGRGGWSTTPSRWRWSGRWC